MDQGGPRPSRHLLIAGPRGGLGLVALRAWSWCGASPDGSGPRTPESSRFGAGAMLGFPETVATLPGSLGLCSCSHSPEMSRKSILGRTRGHHKRLRPYQSVNAGKMSQIIPVAKLQSLKLSGPEMPRMIVVTLIHWYYNDT